MTTPNSSAAQNGIDEFALRNAMAARPESAPQSSIIVGPYRIEQTQFGQYWVGEKDGGEGGMFSESQLLPYIKEFYRDNF